MLRLQGGEVVPSGRDADATVQGWFGGIGRKSLRRTFSHVCLWLDQFRNVIFVQVGGFNGSLRVKTVDAYDAALDLWAACESMEARRSTLGVAVLNNCIYAVGGFDGSTGLNTAEMFDPQVGKWKIIAAMSTRRSSVGVGVLYGQLYAVC